MSRPIRFIPFESLVEVTMSTFQGRFLLQPSEELNDIVRGVLGRAQRLFSMAVHGFAFLSNHFHLLVTARDAKQLAEFMGYFNSNLAREIARLHDWPDKVWGDRYHAIPVTGEDEAQLERLLYILMQGCKEGLVDSPGDWTGVHCVDALVHGTPVVGHWFDRSRECEVRRRKRWTGPIVFPEREVVHLTPLPCLAHLPEPELRARMADLVVQATERARQLRSQTHAHGGKTPVGREHPHHRPDGRKRSTPPRVHAATKQAREAFLDARRWFEIAFRAAAARLRDWQPGLPVPQFPPGSFPPRLPWVSALATT